MAPTSSPIYTTSFVLISIAILYSVKSVFTAHHNITTRLASPWESGRSKWSPPDVMPTTLKIRIKYVTGEEIDLTWFKTNQYVANGHLPVITLLSDPHPNVLHDVSEFVMYQDVTQCSAVVYFKKFNIFYGIIGTNYYISALPYAFNERGEYQLGVIAEPYVLERDNSSPHIPLDNIFPPSDDNKDVDVVPPSNSDPADDHKRKSDYDPGPSTKYQRTDENFEGRRGVEVNQGEDRISSSKKIVKKRGANQFYLETLVFITRDIAERFKKRFGEDHYIEWLVRYYIIYFNALDMVFKQFETTRKILHINIAKIVIENEFLLPFDFMSNENGQFSDIIEKLPQYLRAHQHEYIPDSFDYVFVHTSRGNEDDNIIGLTKTGANLLEARKKNQFYDAVPITVVQYQNNYADYLVAVHEVGQMIGLEIDPDNIALDITQYCHTIMQKGSPKCDNCFIWSVNNRNQYEVFFRENPDRCLLLNAPRSLRPPGASRFLTAQRQCQCFGYDSYLSYISGRPKISVNIHGCNQSLQCQNSYESQSQIQPSVLPFDGTPCAGKKVCWNQKCVSFQ